MTPDVAPLVRAGSGLLFVLLGAFMILRGRAHRANVAAGFWAAGFGTVFLSTNLLMASPATERLGFLVGLGAWIVVAVTATLALAWGFPVATGPRPTRATIAGIAAGVAYAIVAFADILRAGDPGNLAARIAGATPLAYLATASFTIAIAATLAFIVAAAARARHADARELPRLALAATGFGLYHAYSSAQFLYAGGIGALVAVVSVATASGAWLLATARAGKPAIAVAWALLAAALVGLVDQPTFGPSGIASSSPVVGLLRTLGVGLLAYAVLRHDLLGVDLSLPTIRRGSLATGSLVAFFVVAQIAQEFLSDAMGVVLGGAAAGCLLFAAAPLQRAAERLASREVRVREPRPQAEMAYRAAVKLALARGSVTREHERHLADIAEAVGIGPAAALRLREEVEREAAPPAAAFETARDFS